MPHTLHRLSTLALGAAAAALLAMPLAAQLVSQRNVPSVYAITNAKVVPVSGATIEKATIVVRDGLIAAVGAGVAVPGDARVIDATGLTVYPGFIDSYGSLGISEGGAAGGRGGRGAGAAAAAGRGSAAPSANSNYPAGLQPEVAAVDLVHGDEAAFAGATSAGFTTALTAPADGIWQGQSALINLVGDSVAHIVVKAPISQNVGFNPLRSGGYPNSLIGVFSALRQMLLDAQHYRDVQAVYAKNPRGMKRPEYDASLEALQPVINKQMPVVMFAQEQREIERALDLAREFNLKAIIAGGLEAPAVADRLKAEGVPVLLSLNFPRRPALAADADPEPLRALRARVEAPKVAGKLAQAGVKFAFMSGGVPWTELLANVGRSVDNGLAPDAALRAMTISAADILGASDRLGTIEIGKIANLTLSRGDVLDRAGRVTQLFVDGKPFTPHAPAATGAAATATGQYNTTVMLSGGEHQVTLALTQSGRSLSGSYQGALGSGEIANGAIEADGAFHFTATLQVAGHTEEATFTGTFAGNAITGAIVIVGEPTAPGKFIGTRPQAAGRGGRGGVPPEAR